MFVKVCGITRVDDALHAVDHGATAIGFVFWAHSPRFVSAEEAAEIVAKLPDHVTTVGVFVNESVEGIRAVAAKTGIIAVQLHGDEPPEYAQAIGYPILRSANVDTADAVGNAWPPTTTLLVDAADPVRRGGTGQVVDWSRAAELARRRPIVLAGGLTPDNVVAAVAAGRPDGVDVSSGVEASAGLKNPEKVAQFLAKARSALASS
jgi:phosphoribosylanthranilate isomerase